MPESALPATRRPCVLTNASFALGDRVSGEIRNIETLEFLSLFVLGRNRSGLQGLRCLLLRSYRGRQQRH